jgi:hypothetical protein
MPKCQTGIKQPFFQAFTALADEWISAILITEIWHLNQGILLF